MPDNQFGFRKGCGTGDYSAVLSTKLHMALEAKLEAILVALDVAKMLLEHLTRFGGKLR